MRERRFTADFDSTSRLHLPVGGGKATIGETTVRTISPSSPLGEAMVELEVGDAFEVDSPRGLLAFEVSAIG